MCSRRGGQKDGRYGENPNGCSTIIVSGDHETVAAAFRSFYTELAQPRFGVDYGRHDIRLCRGTTWESPNAGRRGLCAGSAGARTWRVAVHLFPAGRGSRMRAGGGRAHLRWSGRDVVQGVGPTSTTSIQRREGATGELWRRVPAGEAGILRHKLKSPIPRCCASSSEAEQAQRNISMPDGERQQQQGKILGAAGLRPGIKASQRLHLTDRRG